MLKTEEIALTESGSFAQLGDPATSDSNASMKSVRAIQPNLGSKRATASKRERQTTVDSQDHREAAKACGADNRAQGRARGDPTLWMYIGQKVRVHLGDLLRTRLSKIPDASLRCMNRFFREMYAYEAETDNQLAQLYAQQNQKSNSTLRAFRRIRGSVTAFYNCGGREGGELDSTRGGVELCFRVLVTVPSESEGSNGEESGAQTREFVVYRRWAICEFMALRKFYKRRYHVEVFVESKGSKEMDGWQPLSAVDRFRSIRPDLSSTKDSTDSDPFIVSGSVLPKLAGGLGAAGDPAVSTPVKKRGRPRKYPRPEDTEDPAQSPSQCQLRPARAPRGSLGTTMKEAGLRVYIGDCVKGEAKDGHMGQMEEEDLADTESCRPCRSREGATKWRRKIGEGVEHVAEPSPRFRETRGAKAATEGSSHLPHRPEDEREGRQQQSLESSTMACVTDGKGSGDSTYLKTTTGLLDVMGRHQQSMHVRHDESFYSPVGSTVSPENGLAPKSILDRPLIGESSDTVEEKLRPYYHRCVELLLSELLDCLHQLAYSGRELEEREEAIAKCLTFSACPSLDLSALQTLINHFGKCVKTKASLTELDIHTQEELVENVLYLSRFVGNPESTKPMK